MKKIMKRAIFVVLLASSCVNFCFAQDNPLTTSPTNEAGKSSIAPESNVSNFSAGNSQGPTVELTKQLTPVVVMPVEKPSAEKKEKLKPIDLKAVIFDPDAKFDAQAEAENREMTKMEEAQYNLHEALHGEVQALGTKGLLADQMKMEFEKGPIESLAPWIDYNGYFSNIWAGEDYKNTLYSINFADIGVNGKMRDGKTAFRLMFSPVKYVEGNTYFNSFFADNYVTRKVGKNNTILVGHTWIPLGIEGKESPLVWQFFTRSQLSSRYSGVRALGTKVMGNYKWADYHLGVYSSGRAFKDFFPGPEVAGWVEFKPLAATGGKYGKLTVGSGFNAGNAQSHYAVLSGAVNYEYKRFRAITEFGTANGSNGAAGYSANKSAGINGTLSYRVTPKLQALVRYDKFDPNTEKDNDIRTEYTAGLNYFLKDHAAKLMLNYVLYSLQNGTYGSKIMVGTQIIL